MDDSKAIYCGGKGRSRLEMTCLAAIYAASNTLPVSLGGLLEIVGAGTLEDAELVRWLAAERSERPGPSDHARGRARDSTRAKTALCARGGLAGDEPGTVVVGPAISTDGWLTTGSSRMSTTKRSSNCSPGSGMVPREVRARKSSVTSTADAITTMAG